MDTVIRATGTNEYMLQSTEKASRIQNHNQSNAKQTEYKPAPQSVTRTIELMQADAQGYQLAMNEEQIVRSIKRVIKEMEGVNTALEFSVHEATRHIMVKVKNSENGETIREIPPEKMLDFLANLWERAGLFIDEQK